MARKTTRAVRKRPHPSISARASGSKSDTRGVQRAVQQTFGRSDLVAVGVLNLVRDTIVTALAGVKDVGGELRGAAVAAARGAIRAAYVISGDLGSVARETVRGTVGAAKEIGGDVGSAANSAAQGAVAATGEVGGDVVAVARRAVEGGVTAAREIGGDVGMIAKDTAAGAIEAADRIGSAAGRAVRTTLSTTVAGVRALVSDAQSRSTSPMPRTQRAPRANGQPRRRIKLRRPRASSRRSPR